MVNGLCVTNQLVGAETGNACSTPHPHTHSVGSLCIGDTAQQVCPNVKLHQDISWDLHSPKHSMATLVAPWKQVSSLKDRLAVGNNFSNFVFRCTPHGMRLEIVTFSWWHGQMLAAPAQSMA